MFAIGDRVAYPLHGAGTIEAIETKKILGKQRLYYILHIGTMEINVPVDCDGGGLRNIVGPEAIDSMKDVLSAESTPMDNNWNRRNRSNMELLKTGDICKVAIVVRNLLRIDRAKKLSTGEKKMLADAIQILVSEMSLVLGITEEEAEDMINCAV